MIVLRSSSSVVVRFQGALDARAVPAARAHVESIVAERPRELVLDLTAVHILDGSGIALVVASIRRVRAEGGRTSVLCGRGQPARLFALLGMEHALAA